MRIRFDGKDTGKVSALIEPKNFFKIWQRHRDSNFEIIHEVESKQRLKKYGQREASRMEKTKDGIKLTRRQQAVLLRARRANVGHLGYRQDV
jgi:hypothetical protein